MIMDTVKATTATVTTITATAKTSDNATHNNGTLTFSSNSTGVCTINSTSGLVAFVNSGTCSIKASLGADTLYAAPADTTITFTINAAAVTVTSAAKTMTALDTIPTLTYTNGTNDADMPMPAISPRATSNCHSCCDRALSR